MHCFEFNGENENSEYEKIVDILKAKLLLDHLHDVVTGESNLDLLPDTEETPEDERLRYERLAYFSLLPECLQNSFRKYVRIPIGRRFSENDCGQKEEQVG